MAAIIRLRTWVQIALLIAIVEIRTPESFASCAPPPPFRCSLPASPVAFLGTVLSKQDVDLRPVQPPNDRGRRLASDPAPPKDDSFTAVTFRVDEALRGDFDDVIVIRTDPANSSAHYPFEIGRDYLVFADMQNGQLYTNSCTGNRDAKTETAFIRELRAARRGSRMSDIFGLVTTRPASFQDAAPAANLMVTAKSDAGEYHALTAVDGTYEFHGLASGRYAIAVQSVPMRTTSGSRALDVGFQAACRVDFQLDYIGQISGTVTTSDNAPVAGIVSASASSADESQSVSSVSEVVDGRFELKQVPPGTYRIRFFPKIRGRIEQYYYPGATSETGAGEIEVGDGTRITGLRFIIP